jgi:hypothetical protein
LKRYHKRTFLCIRSLQVSSYLASIFSTGAFKGRVKLQKAKVHKVKLKVLV